MHRGPCLDEESPQPRGCFITNEGPMMILRVRVNHMSNRALLDPDSVHGNVNVEPKFILCEAHSEVEGCGE